MKYTSRWESKNRHLTSRQYLSQALVEANSKFVNSSVSRSLRIVTLRSGNRAVMNFLHSSHAYSLAKRATPTNRG